MLASDHFVRMYNELFKLLEQLGRGHLVRYWLEISNLQESLMQRYFEMDGYEGLYAYWDHIRKEENCDMDMQVFDDYFELRMNKCPSLSKNLDNDAGLSLNYCEHCAGWINPVLTKHGFYPVYDIISRKQPQCIMRIFRDKKKAIECSKTVHELWDPYGDLTVREE